MSLDQFPNTEPVVEPNYFLSPEELADLEADIVCRTIETNPEEVVAVWVDPCHPFSNISRTHEANYFPEVAELEPEYDKAQEILLLVDTREGEERVIHAATTTKLRDVPREQMIEEQKSGIYTIDSLVGLGNFTVAEFFEYYDGIGIDLTKSLCAETNFKVHPETKVLPFNFLGGADLAYLELYSKLIREGGEIGHTVVIATANSKQIASLARNGFGTLPLLGKDAFVTEEEDLGVVSKPMVIPIDENFKSIMDMIEFKLSTVRIP